MAPRILPPIGAKKRLCRKNSLSTTQSPLFALFVCFQKFFLRVFFYFSVKMCVFILLFYSVTFMVCYFIIQSVWGLNEYEIRQNHQ